MALPLDVQESILQVLKTEKGCRVMPESFGKTRPDAVDEAICRSCSCTQFQTIALSRYVRYYSCLKVSGDLDNLTEIPEGCHNEAAQRGARIARRLMEE